MNPKGEVPVLVHGLVKLVETSRIITYLEMNFNHSAEIPRLFPRLEVQKDKVEDMYRRVQEVNVTVLTLGSIAFSDLELNPHGIFSDNENRHLMQGNHELFKKEFIFELGICRQKNN